MCVCVSFHCCTGLDCSPTQACGIGAGTAGQDKLASTFLRATIFIRCCVGLERSPKQACGIGAGAAGQDKLTKHIFEGYHLHSLLRRPGALPQRGLWHWGWCSRPGQACQHNFECHHLCSLLRRPGALLQRGLWHWGWCSMPGQACQHNFECYHLCSLLRRPGALPQRGLWHWGWCSRLSLAYKESKLGQSLWQKRTPLLLTCFFRYNECQRCVCV